MNPTFIIEMENGQTMKGELYPETAPNSVANFVELANSGFYDGVIFHRVIPGFMIQGATRSAAAPADWATASAANLPATVSITRSSTRGVLSMARSMMPNSAGSQFFIMVDDAPYLDGQYAAFGKVTEGMETADAIVSVPRDPMDKPYEEQKMKSVRVDTHGETYTVEKLKGRG